MEQKILRMKELIQQLNQWSYEYYTLDNPSVSDRTYDEHYDELLKLEEKTNTTLSNSPTQNVQGEVLPYLTKVKHTEPMLSADKSKDINDIIKFIGNQECILSWKLDGLTIVLKYNNGKFIQAVTRGGGSEGEDVTHTVKHFTNIPMTIRYKGYLELRGEGLVPFEEFNRINSELLLKGEETYSSARNLASGSVRQLDANITKNRKLIFLAFGIVKCDNDIWYKDLQFDFLNDLGFSVVYHEKVNKNNIVEKVEEFKNNIPTLPFLTDGLIIEFNDIVYGKEQGVTGHHSRNMMALKHADDTQETIFRGVELNTTRTGMVSITALFDTVEIDGCEVSRASLHNYDIFTDFKLGVGDTITVYRANSVIPQVDENLTQSNTYKIDMKCPCCQSNLEIKTPKTSAFLYCTNPDCSAKLSQRIEHYCSKNATNMDGLASSTIDLFLENGIITNISDLYKLEDKKEQVLKLPKFGKKKLENTLSSIEKSRKVRLENFLFALGIPNVGLSTSKELAKTFKTIHNFINAKNSEIISIADIGDITCESILQYRLNNLDFILELLKYVEFVEEEKKEVILDSSNPLSGKLIYPTGKFSLKKDELKQKLESVGAIIANGYSKKLDYLICGGDISKSGKADKAKEDNVPLMSEDEMMKYLK